MFSMTGPKIVHGAWVQDDKNKRDSMFFKVGAISQTGMLLQTNEPFEFRDDEKLRMRLIIEEEKEVLSLDAKVLLKHNKNLAVSFPKLTTFQRNLLEQLEPAL